jgi:hypothetical protein
VPSSDTILSLEKKVSELLLVRIPFAQKTAGGVDLDATARAAGGLAPAPNATATYPGEYLSPGAGQPELPFSDEAVYSATSATSAAGSGTAEPTFFQRMPGWIWIAAGAGAIGLAWFLTRKRRR